MKPLVFPAIYRTYTNGDGAVLSKETYEKKRVSARRVHVAHVVPVVDKRAARLASGAPLTLGSLSQDPSRAKMRGAHAMLWVTCHECNVSRWKRINTWRAGAITKCVKCTREQYKAHRLPVQMQANIVKKRVAARFQEKSDMARKIV